MERETDLWTAKNAMECWHSDQDASERWGLKCFGWTDDAEKRGLSINNRNVALGHSSGFAALNIAYLMGCDPIILIGHDLRYPKNYDGRKQEPGGKRHYFGEYPDPRLLHWPTQKVLPTGELDGLIQCYNAVASRPKLVEIINCTSGSALECFPHMELGEFLDIIHMNRQRPPVL